MFSLVVATSIASFALAKTAGSGHAGRSTRGGLVLGFLAGFTGEWWLLGASWLSKIAAGLILAAIGYRYAAGHGHASRGGVVGLVFGLVQGFAAAWWLLGWWYD